MEILELNYLDLEENKNYEKIIKKVLQKCFEEENLQDKKLYVNVGGVGGVTTGGYRDFCNNTII